MGGILRGGRICDACGVVGVGGCWDDVGWDGLQDMIWKSGGGQKDRS